MEAHLIQGSDEWKCLRRSKITSVDAATILGINPYCSAYTLWQRKMGLIPEQEQTFAMSEGNRLEPEARASFIALTGIEVEPKVMFHSTNEWMMTSLDGVSKCGRYAAEFKCSKKIYEKALNNQIDELYLCQCQHHMSCLDIPMIYFYAYWEGKGKLIEINRDDAFIEKMIVEEKKFWDSLQSFTAPEPDLVTREDDDWDSRAKAWEFAEEQAKYWKEKAEAGKKSLIELSGDQSTMGCGVKLTTYYMPGKIDYAAIPELQQISLDSYRKAPIKCWRLSKV